MPQAKFGALLLITALLVAACSGPASQQLDIQIATSSVVTLAPDVTEQGNTALARLRDPRATPTQRAAAYRAIADINLFLWDEMHKKLQSEHDWDAATFATINREARRAFLISNRARALSWAENTHIDSPVITRSNLEPRLAEAWEHYEDPPRAFAMLETLYQDTLRHRADAFVDVDFLSDLRYGTAIFYTLIDLPVDEPQRVLDICLQNEAEAVRFTGDVAFLYDRLQTNPARAADAYRAIAQARPSTREGYEAQIAVLTSLKKQRHFGAISEGDENVFDASPEGLALFKTVNKDLAVLVQMAQAKPQWTAAQGPAQAADAEAEDIVRAFALRMHAMGQEDNLPTLYDLAATTYAHYHQLFPKSPYAHEMWFLNGEALYQLQRYDEAYEAYKASLGADPKGTHRDTVVKSLVLTAYERAKDSPLPTAVAQERLEIPQVHRDFIGSGEQFIRILGDSEPQMAGFVRYEIMLRHYLFGEGRVAEPLAEDFIRVYRRHPQANKAAIIWLDILAREVELNGENERRYLNRAIEEIKKSGISLEQPDIKRKLEQVNQQPPLLSGEVPWP